MKHGHAKKGRPTILYMCWLNMKARCDNPRSPAYKNYGGRGIICCERWAVFENFLVDMGPSWPGKGWTIHRIDNDGPYCKDNCIWETRKTQAHFRRPKSEEHRKHLAESVKALGPHTEEHKANISAGLKRAYDEGRRDPTNAAMKIAKSLAGKRLSLEHKKKLSEAKMGRSLSAEHRNKMAEAQQKRRLREREAASI